MRATLGACRLGNHGDDIRTKLGLQKSDEVRSLDLAEVEIETDNVLSILPLTIVEALGLPVNRGVVVRMTWGAVDANVYDDLQVDVCGRSTSTQCIGIPGGSYALLGRIVADTLGIRIEPDGSPTLLPTTGPNTFYRV